MPSFYMSLFLILILVYHSNAYTPSPTLPYQTSTDDCFANFPDVAASFDLCHLRITDQGGQLKHYKVFDSRKVNTTSTDMAAEYAYYFNIADQLQLPPPICFNTTFNHSYCPDNTNCSGYTNTVPIAVDTAWAFQVKYDVSTTPMTPIDCWALSDSMPHGALWSLLDEEDPSLGVQLTYTHGDYDDGTQCQSNRKLNLRFECEDNILFIPENIPLYEYTPCEYTLSVPSQYGCPIQCKLYDDQLCGSHGLCAYDNTNDAPRCFCFNTYTEDDCSVYDESEGIPPDSAKVAPVNQFVFTFTNALDTGVDVVYDLGAFGAPQSHAGQNGGLYIVHDKDFDNDRDRTWVYYVYITQPVVAMNSDVLPAFCRDIIGPCTEYDGGGDCLDYEQEWNGHGLVFQANNATKECYLLGRFANGSPSADLFDQIDDPTRGVTVTYGEGSWCAEAKRNREFRVNLVCPRDHSAVYDPYEETVVNLYEYVEEEELCIYSFTMTSAIACPYQCVTNTTDLENKEAFTVCSQTGICAADPEAKFVRCLCDEGWKGVYCAQIDSDEPTASPTAAPGGDTAAASIAKLGRFVAVICILVVVILVVLGIGYYVYRNQKLKISQQEDEISFHKMSDKGIVGKDAVSTNVVTDEKGKRGFATIAATQVGGNDDGESN